MDESKIAELLKGVTDPAEIVKIIGRLVEDTKPKRRRQSYKSTPAERDDVFMAGFPCVMTMEKLAEFDYVAVDEQIPQKENCRHCGVFIKFDAYQIRGRALYYRCPNCGWMGKLAESKCSRRCICVGGICKDRHVPFALDDIIPDARKWYYQHPCADNKNNLVPNFLEGAWLDKTHVVKL